MDKDELPRYDELVAPRRRKHRHRKRRIVKLLVIFCLIYLVFTTLYNARGSKQHSNALLSQRKLRENHETCSKLRSKPKDPSGSRERNARYIEGNEPVLIRNATVWTGDPIPGASPEDIKSGQGYSWHQTDVLMEHGLIKRVEPGIASLPEGCVVYEAHGRQLTAGIVDMHSHAGPDPLPELTGGEDENEVSGDVTPFARVLDAINPLDNQLQVIKSGGVTSSLVLPGSANNIAGEAVVIKHAVGKPDGRAQISAEDMLADPERNWRYMKMACGENAKRVYGRIGRGPASRMGEAWQFRHGFEQAAALRTKQDDWCAAADEYGVESMTEYLPEDLRWESLSAVLRGQVHVNTHCYTIADLESFVRHTNEFAFPIRAFHHAHQTYLVPEILKRAYGERPPAAALFADNMYYKLEAYTASEQAGKILNEQGITPVYVSDNPVLNAQHVVFEAAKAYRYGLPYHVALAGVTSASAELLGLGERIGKVKPGYDADVVVWDSDPLSVGAAPAQVWIDGAAQFDHPVELNKAFAPTEPDTAIRDTYDSLIEETNAIFTGITKVMLPGHEEDFTQGHRRRNRATLVMTNGTITCLGTCEAEVQTAKEHNFPSFSLRDGHIIPPLTAFGSSLGMEEIAGESDTKDGANDDDSFSAAIDGLMLDGKGLAAAYRHGVTRAISAPAYKGGGSKGVSVGFRTGAINTVQEGAVWQNRISLHYDLTLNAKQGKTPSLSSAVGELRRKLLKAVKDEDAEASKEPSDEETSLLAVVQGALPLVISVHSADIIASLLRVKSEIDQVLEVSSKAKPLRLIIIGGAESHLVAPELAAAEVGVVLAPMLPYAVEWDQRRSLTGAPLTNGTALDALISAGVKVAISTSEDWETRDLDLLAGIAYANAGGKVSESEALALAGANIYEMLGLEETGEGLDEFVVYEGNPLRIEGRVRAVIDGRGKASIWS
ncbi:hypothetical protein MBLNU230_g0368t1 [Neophaeotheca triangularis]